ncbi:serine hydrolase domain-containing protein [Stenotrophomonas sp. 24(2023)]|uniref:serine hydrolase domain-containing protein n=1 Tax=Stenotrophomonas sp. 24(2023) TaxID=3068324 RepID=UPI0027DF1787|nr:serine hydrolase domain-containing protein [Stenotrophomonas sp. 24(2023)]WMJ70695.1 serine hydrolase domain-containing protein [Stenotrophomonas sp. 24(2023)]
MHRARRFLLSMLLCWPMLALARDPLPDLVAQRAQALDFNGTVLVQQAGQPLLLRSFGLADRRFGVPDTNQTVYRIASITKLFTAVLVLQLHEQGRLDLQQTVAHYLPALAHDAVGQVTLHQLLNHTSGLANIDAIPNIEDRRAWIAAALDDARTQQRLPLYQTPYTPEELMQRFCRGPRVAPPGTRFDYNNADYIVLGRIIEALHGTSYTQVLTEQLLAPLGMTHTGMARQAVPVPGLASTYSLAADGTTLENDPPVYTENWDAAGGLYSTAEDLLRFSDALFSGRLLAPDAQRRMTTPGLDDHGYGVWIRSQRIAGTPHRFLSRPGRIMGARSKLYHDLDGGLTVILLSNAGTTDLDAFAAWIAAHAHARDDPSQALRRTTH